MQRIVERGHERACHGDGHVLVFGQSCCEYEADVRPACAAIEEFTGKRPVGYRAPTFGVNAMSRGAGGAGRAGLRLRLGHFRNPGARGGYSRPAHSGRRPAVGVPDRQLAGWQPVRVPIGGASYWGLAPTPGLGRQTPHSRRDANVVRLNDRRAVAR
ncbi:MAG TPA: polysaccharide deacetylase family protein, partial [Gemmatimonadales bacterium]|nr:polysaccharide deacetylase family protein [Gemmatimonadales bacterium]